MATITHQDAFHALLKRLNDQLTELLEIANRGEWERVETLGHALAADLAHLNAIPRQSLLSQPYRQQIIGIQRLLVDAQSSCSTRLEQIRPLVDALGRARITPGSS